MIIAAVLASILRVDYLHNAILINTAENRINSGIYTNVAIVKGWNFNFVTFPKYSFHIIIVANFKLHLEIRHKIKKILTFLIKRLVYNFQV